MAEALRVAHVIADVGSGYAGLSAGRALRTFQLISQDDQTIRVGERQRTQQHSLDDGKNRRRRPNAQRQHQDGRHSKSGRLTQLAEGNSSVLQNLAQPLKRSLVAMQLLRLLHASIGDSGRPSRIFRRHALAQIFAFQKREVRVNLSCQFRFHSGVGEKQRKLQEDTSQVLHG